MDRQALIVISASIAAFVCIGGIVVAVGMELRRKKIIATRLSMANADASSSEIGVDSNDYKLSERIAHVIDLDLIASIMSNEKQTKLRSDLIKAGLFDSKAPVYFMMATALCVVIFSVFGFSIIRTYLLNMPIEQQFLIIATFAYSGYFITDIFLRNRIRAVSQEYQSTFPDFLDLLVVCVDAGLSLNAALDRVTLEFYPRSRALSTNFSVMLQEIRIGRETTDALDNLAARMEVDEIRSFCTLLKQSIELGSDVSEALRVYSEDMRIRRLLKAEEAANKLPVKMLLPLGLFIFPVILIVILVPVAVKFVIINK